MIMEVKEAAKTASRSLVALLLMSTIAGCASMSKRPEPVSFDAAMSLAEAQVATGEARAAIGAFEQAAEADPARKEPWVRIAQLQFDQGSYARAMVAADQVLQIDPDDLVADGVMTVAGLRLAHQSLTRLQGRGGLASGTAQKEAQALVDVLRRTMGSDVLAPEKKTTPRRRAGGGRASTGAVPAARSPARPASRSTGADPFQNVGN